MVVRNLKVDMAVFYNVENIHPNIFLLNDGDDNDVQNHPRTCFCIRCRAVEVADIHDRYIPNVDDQRMLNELRHMMITVLPRRLSLAQDRVFEITRKLIVHGKIYKEAALKNGDYTLFKCWAKTQPYYQQFINGNKQTKKEFDKHCQYVNDCAFVYDNWDKIVHNLTNESLTNLNARTFAVGKFREAVDFNWCISKNERARTGTAPRRQGEQLWTSDDVTEAAIHILNVARLDEADRHQTSRFCQAVERKGLALVKERMQEQDSFQG